MTSDHMGYCDRVDIPEPLITFFQKRNSQLGLYLPSKKGKSFSYEMVVGDNAEELPARLNPSKVKADGYPFTNLDEESRTRADTASILAIESIYGRSIYDSIDRAYMINGYTSPVRITFRMGGKKTKREVYVKRPDASRIVGRYLYDLISGIPPIRYAFNELVFVEENVPGKLLSKSNEKYLLRYIDYQEGIIRAAVHAEFLGLPRDVTYGWNRFVDSQLRTVLFDFDMIFQKRDSPKNPLLNQYRDDIDLSSDHFMSIVQQEKCAIARRLVDHKKKLREIGRIAGTMVECDGKTLDERVRDYTRGGSDSLAGYFVDQISLLRGDLA